MSKRRPTDAQLVEMLTQPHFGQQREIAPQDPITATPMIVEIDHIDYYDRNPRRSPNDKYQEIKASIASGEMDQPLTITRRPGAPRYMVFKGGNTRLRALKELFAETGGERFQRIHCLFQPWTRESDALLGHLKENDLRGDLVFIDRALAIRELRQLLEKEAAGGQLSQRQLVEMLRDRGYSISQPLIAWFDYAVDVLHQAIPSALKSGMGRPQIERIKTLDRSFGQCWKSLELGADGMAQSVFVEVLSRYDAEQLDLDAIRRDLETELSVTADIDVQRASLLMGAALDGRALSEGPTATYRGGNEQPQEHAQELATPGHPDTAGTRPSPAAPTQVSGKPAGNAEPEPSQKNAGRKEHSGRSEEKETSGRAPTSGRQPPVAVPAEDLPALRERAAKLARDIAVLARMGDQIIHPIPDGVGYLIGPTSLMPSDNLISVSDEHVRHLVYLWWTLAQISEQFADDSRAGIRLPQEWRDTPFDEAIQHAGNWEFFQWHAFIEDERAPVVWDLIPMATLPGFGPLLWPKMHDWAWDMFVELVGVYRAIHKAANGKVWG